MLSEIGLGCESRVYSEPSLNFVVKLRFKSVFYNTTEFTALDFYKCIIHFHNVLFPETRYVYGGKHIGGSDILIQPKIVGEKCYDCEMYQRYDEAIDKARELKLYVNDCHSGNVIANKNGIFFIDPAICNVSEKYVPTCVLMDEILNDAWEYLVNYKAEVKIEA